MLLLDLLLLDRTALDDEEKEERLLELFELLEYLSVEDELWELLLLELLL